jgi:chemotaxis methyl-accepting protein methylase
MTRILLWIRYPVPLVEERMKLSWTGEGEVTLERVAAFVEEVASDLDPDTRYLSELRQVLSQAEDLADYLRRLGDRSRVRGFRRDGSQVSLGERGRSWVDDETWERMDPFERTLSNLLTGETRMMWSGEGEGDFKKFAKALAGHEGELRVLSVPCSTGKEAYSLAIAGLLAGKDVRVTGVDRQAAYVLRARSGRLVPHQRDWEHPRAEEFLERGEAFTRVESHVLERCTFEQGDVLVPQLPEPGFHVVSCRNLLGYFRGETLRAAWSHVAARVRPGGYLVHDRFVAESDEMTLAQELLVEHGFRRLCDSAHWFQAPADWGL